MLHRLEFHAMGCGMLAALESDSPDAERQLAHVPEWFEKWEQALSRFRNDSELSRLNRSGGRPMHVSATLWEAFAAARRAEQLTEGLVTPTVLNALTLAGYDRSFELLTDDLAGPIETGWAEVCPLSRVAWDRQERTICLPPGVQLDLGGSAKGWAAHHAAQRLSSHGPALVDAAGDIALSGSRAGGAPWLIGLADPFQQGSDAEMLALHRCGVATSGRDRRRWKRSGMAAHHIIDPVTGGPAETDVMTATVIAPEVMEAEACAKAALILGSRDGLKWLEARPHIQGLLILESGEHLATSGFGRFLD